MKNKTIYKCEDILDILFLCTYVFVVLYSTIRIAGFPVEWSGFLPKIEEMIMSFWLIFAFYKIYVNYSYNLKNTIFAILLLTGVIVSVKLELNNFLYIVAPMIIAYRMDFNRIAKMYAITMGITLSVIYTLSKLDILSAYTYTQPNKNGQLLQLLGFGNSNTFMGYWLFLVMAILYLIRDNDKWLWWLLGELFVTWVIYLQTGSRSSTVLIVMLCFSFLMWKLFAFFKLYQIKNLFWNYLAPFMIPIPLYMALLTAFLVLFYNIFQFDNGVSILSSFLYRAMYIDQTLESLNVKLPNAIFATANKVDIPFSWIIGTGAYNYGKNDILYANLLIEDGLIVLIPYLLFNVFFLFKAYRQRDFVIFMILIAIHVLGMMEAWALLPGSSLFFLLFFADWRMTNDKK